MIVQIYGLGYIGLPLAVTAVNAGFTVRGVDINPEVISKLRGGVLQIEEPGLQQAFDKALSSGRFSLSETSTFADVHVIAVPTPVDAAGLPDISIVEAVASDISSVAREDDLVVLESTCPVGTGKHLAEILNIPPNGCSGAKAGRVSVASCPERILPGKALHELVHNDRVIGGVSSECAKKAAEFYSGFCLGELRIAESSDAAELVKLIENSYRDVNIAFANEISKICDSIGTDVWEAIGLANMHPRVNVLQPGAGVGGHCIAVDPWFLVNAFPNDTQLIRSARRVNDDKPLWVVSKLMSALDGVTGLGRKKVAIFGLTFKPNIDDVRESPSIQICKVLAQDPDLQISVVEPHLKTLPDELHGYDIEALDLETAITWADTCLVLVKHDFFTDQIALIENHGSIVDICGLLSGGENVS